MSARWRALGMCASLLAFLWVANLLAQPPGTGSPPPTAAPPVALPTATPPAPAPPATALPTATTPAPPQAGALSTRQPPKRVVAATPVAPEPEATQAKPESTWDKIQNVFWSDGAQLLKRILLALLLFVGGWFLARLIQWTVYRILLKTEIDNWIADKLGLALLFDDKEIAEETDEVERFMSKVVYYLLMLLVIVGVLETLELETAAKPIENLVTKVTEALPDIGKAVLILVAAWAAGTILQRLIGRSLGRFDAKLSEMSARPGEEAETQPFSETTGKVVFWLIMVIGIASAVEALKIEALASPMQGAIDSLIDLFPKVAIAALILLFGFFLSRVIRQVVQNFSHSMGVDALPEKVKFESVFEKRSLSEVLGLIVMYLVLFQATVAALDRLELKTLSEPLTGVSTQFWNVLPTLIGSGVLIVIGIVLGRVVRGIVEGMLKSAGFDAFMERLGFEKLVGRAENMDEPSELVGFLVQVAIILLVAAQVLDNLHLTTWALYVNTFLGFFLKHAIVAGIIVGVGFAIGNYVRDAVVAGAEDDDSKRWLGGLARYTILVFSMTMAIQQLGVAEDFVLLSFALLFGALCFALALAFGLGSREIAQEIVQTQYEKAKEQLGSGDDPADTP